MNKEYVKNPETNRPILVGGETWRRVMRKRVEENDSKKNLKDKDARKKRQFIRKRHDKEFVVHNTPKKEDIANYVAKCAGRTVHKHMDTLSTQLDEAYAQNNELTDEALAEYEENVKNLILVEMLKEDNNEPASKTMNKTALEKNKKIREQSKAKQLEKYNNNTFEEVEVAVEVDTISETPTEETDNKLNFTKPLESSEEYEGQYEESLRYEEELKKNEIEYI